MSTSDPGPSSTPDRPVPGQALRARFAVTSLGLGLVALLGLCWIPALTIVTLFVGPPAVILGLFGRRSVSPGDKVMSLLGIYTGTLAIVVSVVMITLAAHNAHDGALA